MKNRPVSLTEQLSKGLYSGAFHDMFVHCWQVHQNLLENVPFQPAPPQVSLTDSDSVEGRCLDYSALHPVKAYCMVEELRRVLCPQWFGLSCLDANFNKGTFSRFPPLLTAEINI